MEKLIITIAPTGNVPTKEMTPHVPVTAEEIVTDVIQCVERGAGVAHIHARDPEGKPAHEKIYFEETVRILQNSGCPAVVQLSTGARGGKGAAERSEVLELNPESASLATGSSNFPAGINGNAPDLIEHLATVMKERSIKPEIEVFDTAMIHNAVQMEKRGLIQGPLQFNLVLGVKGSMPATAKNLFFLVDSLPPGAIWTVSVIGPEHVSLSSVAIALGGHVRVGIEDNIFYTKGVLATNVMLVDRIVKIAGAMGREIASPDDVRRILNLNR